MNEWPADCTRLLPETAGQRAEEIDTIQGRRFVVTQELSQESDEAQMGD